MTGKFVFVAAAVMVLAAVSNVEAKEGFFLGAGTAYNSIKGEFDGTGGLKNDTEVIILPSVDNAFGIDFCGGYGINDRWAVELNLMSSGHNGTWQGLTGKVSFTSFSINGKYTFSSSGAAQPYVLFGISNNRLLIKKGASVIATGEVDDAELTGIGFNLGTGVDVYVSPHVSLNPGIMLRYVEYTSAAGVHNSGTITDGIKGSGVSLLLTAVYHF